MFLKSEHLFLQVALKHLQQNHLGCLKNKFLGLCLSKSTSWGVRRIGKYFLNKHPRRFCCSLKLDYSCTKLSCCFLFSGKELSALLNFVYYIYIVLGLTEIISIIRTFRPCTCSLDYLIQPFNRVLIEEKHEVHIWYELWRGHHRFKTNISIAYKAASKQN